MTFAPLRTLWPGIVAAAHPAHVRGAAVHGGGFDWAAVAIGAASGFGIALILVGALLLAPLPTRRKLVA